MKWNGGKIEGKPGRETAIVWPTAAITSSEYHVTLGTNFPFNLSNKTNLYLLQTKRRELDENWTRIPRRRISDNFNHKCMIWSIWRRTECLGGRDTTVKDWPRVPSSWGTCDLLPGNAPPSLQDRSEGRRAAAWASSHKKNNRWTLKAIRRFWPRVVEINVKRPTHFDVRMEGSKWQVKYAQSRHFRFFVSCKEDWGILCSILVE